MRDKETENRPLSPGGGGLRAKVKLTIHGQERFFGPGICELLEKIKETGSIQAAAALMEMSYSKAWKILNRAEKEMGTELIIRVNGGKNGGSSTLTEAGERAIHDFRKMEEELTREAVRLLEEYARTFAGKPQASGSGVP